MATQVVELSGDEAALLRSYDRAVKKQAELEAKLRAAATSERLPAHRSKTHWPRSKRPTIKRSRDCSPISVGSGLKLGGCRRHERHTSSTQAKRAFDPSIRSWHRYARSTQLQRTQLQPLVNRSSTQPITARHSFATSSTSSSHGPRGTPGGRRDQGLTGRRRQDERKVDRRRGEGTAQDRPEAAAAAESHHRQHEERHGHLCRHVHHDGKHAIAEITASSLHTFGVQEAIKRSTIT